MAKKEDIKKIEAAELDAVMARINDLNRQLKEAKAEAEAYQNELMAKMKESGDFKVESERFSYTFVDAYIKKIVDTDKLKEAGLYEEYSKESFVRESLKVKELA